MFTSGISPAFPYTQNTGIRETGRKRGRSTVGEKRLSAKGQDYLDKLRGKFADYDIIVADDDDDREGLLYESDKDFAVLFSSEELEKMAEDPTYADGKLNRLQSIVAMSTRICEENGFVLEHGDKPATQDGGYLRSLAFSVSSDGTVGFSAELEDLNGKRSIVSATSEAEFVKKLQALKKE